MKQIRNMVEDPLCPSACFAMTDRVEKIIFIHGLGGGKSIVWNCD